MWNYIKYLLKLYFGAMIIVALNTILKKADPLVGDDEHKEWEEVKYE